MVKAERYSAPIFIFRNQPTGTVSVQEVTAGVFWGADMKISSGILYAEMPVAIKESILAFEHYIVPKFVTTTALFSRILNLLTLTILLYLV